MAFDCLLKPGQIGPVKLKNRIMFASHATNLCHETGEVSDALVDYMARRARGGVGLIISELLLAATEIDPLRLTPISLRADDARFIPGLARLTKVVHEGGAKIGVQMSPGAGAQALGGPWRPGSSEVRAVSPSGVLALGRHTHAMNPRILTVDEIRRIVELCGIAATNIKEAGFDLIELHAHGGYLIHQFLSPYFNKRIDEYGGTLENRCRFLLEIVASVKRAVSSEVALTVKWSVEDFLPGGWDAAQSRELVKMLEAAGVDGLCASSGVHGSSFPAAPPYFYPVGTFLPFAEKVRSATRLPLFTSGRLDDPHLAERVLRDGKIDFVQVCRGLIAEPDWGRKVANDQPEDIRPCLACNYCRHQLSLGKSLRCSVNAEAGREGLFDLGARAKTRRRVLVIGGGPAGMEAARIAALRGHAVTLCEKHKRLGGMTLVAGVHNERITDLNRWFVGQVKKLPITIKLNTEITTALMMEGQQDAVIVATGGHFIKPEVPGIDGKNVFSSSDLLEVMRGGVLQKGVLLRALSPFAWAMATPALMRFLLGMRYPITKRVAVIGGQFSGCSLALLLARKGKHVTVIEESQQFGSDMESNTLDGLNNEVSAGRVTILTSTKVLRITVQGVMVMAANGETSLVEAGSVLVAVGLNPDPGRWDEELNGKAEVHVIGDAKIFQRIPMAVSDGYVTAMGL